MKIRLFEPKLKFDYIRPTVLTNRPPAAVDFFSNIRKDASRRSEIPHFRSLGSMYREYGPDNPFTNADITHFVRTIERYHDKDLRASQPLYYKDFLHITTELMRSVERYYSLIQTLSPMLYGEYLAEAQDLYSLFSNIQICHNHPELAGDSLGSLRSILLGVMKDLKNEPDPIMGDIGRSRKYFRLLDEIRFKLSPQQIVDPKNQCLLAAAYQQYGNFSNYLTWAVNILGSSSPDELLEPDSLNSALNIISSSFKSHRNLLFTQCRDLLLPSGIIPGVSLVVEELLKNTPEKGDATLTAGEISGQIHIEVSNTGVIIPKRNFKKIFFVGYSTKPKDHGSALAIGLGLGLPKARNMARFLGGDIRLESKWQTGTTFTLTLQNKIQW